MALAMAKIRAFEQRIWAKAHLILCKRLGQQVSYLTTAGGTPVTVWSLPAGRGKANGRITLNVRVQESEKWFEIPRQKDSTGALIFPPTNGIVLDQTITDENSDTWVVREWSNDDGVDAVFMLRTVATKPIQAGAVGT